jgi:hypothetical protein
MAQLATEHIVWDDEPDPSRQPHTDPGGTQRRAVLVEHAAASRAN